MPELSGATYSEIDASNNQAAPNGMPEGMPPSGVNDLWRAAMGALKRSYDRDHAGSWCTVGGTGDAITLAYSVAPAAYVQGEKYAFLATAANTGATTVDINALGATNVFKKSPSGAAAACAGGEIQDGDIVEIEYDGTQFQLVSAAPGVGSIANATNGGLAFSASAGAVTANLEPSDLLTKATPTASDSLVIQDAAASNAAKTATIASMAASSATTLTGTDATKWLTAGGFAGNKSLAASGYYKLPGGLIVQWGSATVGGSSQSTVTFPTAFPTACDSVVVSYGGTATNASLPSKAPGAGSITASNFALANGSSTSQLLSWLAVGH